ncbi:prepilin-type N-terminal cleavage/methylation domain-containing protein [Caulobacter soli]|uniref:prepilin-type N-terminal cleavage/methylation domain-containing protein n=1 Tax=Caulobacter soli TaxID=2708539 RepID=UPI0013EA81B6|nr:prepilin-type N-terminal cleavage/methylation domain-containing protein [Caulobacter soli]
MRRAGYTLIELLVALGVMGLLGVMLLAGLSGSSAAWTRMDRSTTHDEAIEAAQDVLRERLQHAWPATRYDLHPAGPDFDGDSARLVFLAPPSDREGPGALRRYGLVLDANGDLVLESLSDVALDQTRPQRREVVLRGVRSLDIGYFGAIEPDPAPRWRSRWRQRPRMPSLVRIRLELAQDGARWPDLVVHPFADMDSECILVVATGGCSGR